jgi:hypothetical protein
MLKRACYSLAIILGLLGGCSVRRSNEPIYEPIIQPVTPDHVIVTNPQGPIPEELFSNVIGLKTSDLLKKIGAPWRIVPGKPEIWHYRVDRTEDDVTSDAEIFVKDGTVVDANVDF